MKYVNIAGYIESDIYRAVEPDPYHGVEVDPYCA